MPKAEAQENIALKASEVRTSYVSSWETLSAINDGYDPSGSSDKSHGAYGNWKNGAFNEWNWVEYDFSEYYKIFQSDVYWWTDQTDLSSAVGVQIPYDCYIQYWDFLNNEWVEVKNPVGYGVEKDMYNVTVFDTVLTNKIRLNFISIAAQGILEWKVFGMQGEQVPDKSTATISDSLAHGKTSTVTLTAIDATGNRVEGYSFKVNFDIENNISVTNEIYTINGVEYSDSSATINLPETNSNGEVSFDITLPETVDPTDGITLTMLFNDGVTPLRSLSFVLPGLTSPVLLPDTTENSVDNDLQITFTDDEIWRSQVTKVVCDGIQLSPDSYQFDAGKLIIKLAGDASWLSSIGDKQIVIYATGYEPASVMQTIKAGSVNAESSSLSASLNLYRNSTVKVTVSVNDRMGNPIAGDVLNWSAKVTNNDAATNEVYTIDGAEVSSDVSGNNLAATDENGQVSFYVSIPGTVDKGDGIELTAQISNGTNISGSVAYQARQGEKEIYVTNTLKSNKEWSYDRTAQSDNFVIFWGTLVGQDPENPDNGDKNIDFDPKKILDELEGFYELFIDSFSFITDADTGNLSKYKIDIIIEN